MARVLIVAKTRMGDYYTCVGGLNLDTNESVRLLKPGNSNQSANTPFNIGQIWDIEYVKRQDLELPHVEDVIIQSFKYKDHITNLKEFLLYRVQPWRGGINRLFGGYLTLQDKKAYIAINTQYPKESTGYWISDKPLWRKELEDKIYYIHNFKNQPYEIKYVGLADPIRQVPAGALVRVSLARWLQPRGYVEKRCYLQISGWYI